MAGIEIENSLNAEVYENEATENTGGILVFDLPDLILKKEEIRRFIKTTYTTITSQILLQKGILLLKFPTEQAC